jgi:hypothetical protein
MLAISSMAAWKDASLALDGLWKPLIFRTNWSEASRTSSGATGGSKLKSVLMFLHMVNEVSVAELGPRDKVASLKTGEVRAGAEERRVTHPLQKPQTANGRPPRRRQRIKCSTHLNLHLVKHLEMPLARISLFRFEMT